MKKKEFNIIVLKNTEKLIKEMFKQEKRTAKQCHQNLAHIIYGNVQNSMDVMLRGSMGELSLEILSLLKECYEKDGIKSTRATKEMMKNIKNKLPKDFSSVDSERFLKLVRDSISHNSIKNGNISDKDFNSFELLLPSNDGEKVPLNLSKLRLIKYMVDYDYARNLDKCFARLDFDKKYCDSVNDVLLGKKKLDKFSKFMKVYNVKEEEIDIDQYQENAYFRFLLKYKKLETKLKNFDYFKMRFFPLKDNKLNNYELKNRLFFFYGYLFKNIDLKMSDLVKILKNENDPCGMFCFMDEETLVSIVYSSVCFNMFSSRNNKEILELLQAAGLDIAEEKVRHLRNSFIHGRYFYNYKNGFEIYDGIGTMEHYLTFDFEQINKLFAEYSKEHTKKIKEERIKFLLKQNNLDM